MEPIWKLCIFKLSALGVTQRELQDISEPNVVVTIKVGGCLINIKRLSIDKKYIGCLVNESDGPFGEDDVKKAVLEVLFKACSHANFINRFKETAELTMIPVDPDSFDLAFRLI